MSNSLATLASPIGDTDGYSVATGATLGQWPGPLTTDFQRVKDTFNLGTTRNRQPGVCKDWDGTTQYATLPSAIGLTGAFAVSVWVNPDAVNTRSIIGGATDAHIQLTLTGYSVRLINAGSVVTGGSALATGAWSHLLFERDGANSITVRVNNGAPTTLGTISGTTQFDRLAATAAAALFDGKMHDLRIFNRVLTADERAILAAGKALGPLATYWWKLDSRYSFEADCSGSGAHAAIVGWTSALAYSGSDVKISFQNDYGWADIGNAANIIAAPNTFTGWVGTNITVIDNAAYESTDTSFTAARLYSAVTLTEHKLQRSNTVPSTDGRTPYTFRIDIRRHGTSQNRVGIAIGDSTLTAFCQVQIDCGSGAIIGNTNATWSITDSRVERLSGDWLRVWVTGVPTSGVTDVQCAVRLFDNAGTVSWTGVGAAHGLLLANAKLSKGECRGTRRESLVTQDLWGNTLDYTGRCPIRPKLINSNCLTLNGTTQYVGFTPTTIWDTDGTQAMDISAWVNTVGAGSQAICGNMLTSGTFAGWNLIMSVGGIIFYLFSTGTNAIAVDTMLSTFPFYINDGRWHFIRCTYDGSKAGAGVRFWIDGVRVNANITQNNLTTSTTTTAPSQIGARNGGNFFGGQIASLSISIGVNSWFYPLAEGAGSTCYNTKANQHHGTIAAAGTNWGTLQDVYHRNIVYGYRNSAGTLIPALDSGASAADGNALTNSPGGHNAAETKFNWSYDSTADPFIRLVGGTVPTAHTRALALPSNFTSYLTATNETSFRAARA